ncbi:hypothetical protein [Campylobacter sp.]|uniref:hypothetical protein n=1 Tax=Campylobacter sp. TaxID=205 RepID=UPI002AA821F3|nr:hypothetical protein [Campylobacter sp.]MCI7237120.1 hypothetical protein [Campylobacter sp.]
MKKKYFFTAFILVVVSAFCLLCGRIGLEQLYSYYISNDETFGVIFWDLRLPRLLLLRCHLFEAQLLAEHLL